MSPMQGNEPIWRTIGYHARSAFAVILSLTVLIGGGWFVYDKVNAAYVEWRTEEDYLGDGVGEVEVLVGKDPSATQLGDQLTELGVVKSTKAFRSAVNESGRWSELRAGRYLLKKELPAEKAFAMLLDADNQVNLWVTFPEGTTAKEQADYIAARIDVTKKVDDGNGGTKNETIRTIELDPNDVADAYADPDKYKLPKWAKGLEGFLFPARYQVAEPVSASSIIRTQIAQFKKVVKETDLDRRAKEMGMKPLEVLTVASIIEGEVHQAEYQPMVAAVIYNRLEQGIKLEMDSTVHYAVGKSGKVTTTAEDRKSDSPYNTYKHKGLPPGPINNPGKTAIEAALSPADTDALFFVTVDLDTGETLFAKTNAEHEANRAKFQAWCSANKDRGLC
ncbi:endolytic transglycosylase MltG [Tessaracoccus caeni]|uniref:endolytic transglycosylase MltG n=1 Tax=Tessaracoccus caeni TaxID=3031239 RepID=UPI0023DCBB24|nr:endolytic transglycosylase MltG [Tessaracoccus caeni]MDF1490285.1 endolytic transglycosylase MltG [Tessaracoccus caeni]